MFDRAKVFISDTGKCFKLLKELGRGSYGIVTLVSHNKIKYGEKLSFMIKLQLFFSFDMINFLAQQNTDQLVV